LKDSRDMVERISNELRTATRDALLDPRLWQDVLEEYALAMNLAVALTDTQGQVLGECINPRPLWSLFRAQVSQKPGICPFCLIRSEPCTAIADALHQGQIMLTRDRLGLAHFVIPLQLGNQQLGTLIAGQVFDQFPDRLQLELEQTARRLDLSPQQVWNLASRQRPVLHKTLQIYAKLLHTLGSTFVETRYHTLMESERSTLLSRLYEQVRISEQQYRLLAEALPQFVWNLRPSGQVTYCNQHSYQYTGLTSEQTLGSGWADVLHPDDQQRTQVAWQTALRTGKNYEIEYRVRRAKDGQYRWHLASIGPMCDHNGQMISWVGTAIDIEDRKQAEATLQHQTEQLIEANKIKDEFLAVLSHELRSPLNPILSWSKLLQSHQYDEQTTLRALAVIERNAQLQAQLIGDLLDVSRILQGKLSFDVSPIDLATTIQAAIETVRLAAEAKAIQIQVTVEPGVGPVLGDFGRLQQVIWNLLSNAIKFTSDGGRVGIGLRRVNTQVQLMVSDTGKGIASDFLPYVFEYFRQADSTITRKFGGLGLGLAIVRRLVELHGGTVWAESAGEGQGATFIVRLPLTQQQSTPKLDDTESRQSLDLQGVRVLIVDDDADTRDVTTFLLEEYGMNITALASAAEALITLTQCQFDVLISDIGMPEMDGYMLLQQVRSSSEPNSQVPAIALTAYAGEIDHQRTIAAGFQRHLAKPIEPDLLIQAISQVIAQAALNPNR
jgi:PAS domain S-box-containing protein